MPTLHTGALLAGFILALLVAIFVRWLESMILSYIVIQLVATGGNRLRSFKVPFDVQLSQA